MFHRMLKGLIVAAGLCALPAVAQAEIFMLITGVQGDSTARGHEKWIRVSSLDWNTTAVTSFSTGGGVSVGKPKPEAIQLILPSGTWSQHFMRLMSLGKSLPTVIFDAVASDGRPLYRITAEVFFVTQYRLESLPTTPLPQDHISGVFRKVKIEYYTTGADGRVTSTFFEWDTPLGIVLPPL